jgi:hypothetical protein
VVEEGFDKIKHGPCLYRFFNKEQDTGVEIGEIGEIGEISFMSLAKFPLFSHLFFFA